MVNFASLFSYLFLSLFGKNYDVAVLVALVFLGIGDCHSICR